MPCGVTHDGWVMVETSDKTLSTGEGDGKPLQHYYLENHKKSMTRQKDTTLKGELPSQEVPNMLLEKREEITPKRMKSLNQSKYNAQLWM